MQSEEVVVRSILTNALDDKQFCEEELPDSMGDPLRVCDVAYNQIVLHFRNSGCASHHWHSP